MIKVMHYLYITVHQALLRIWLNTTGIRPLDTSAKQTFKVLNKQILFYFSKKLLNLTQP